ncbi:MAG: DUF5343 domain-containing protein [Candidatus Zambryskibacteria bacterium]|nr:DUF5343 domain-containing protein [Candidatus Zambryskibacteria bacterium]
MTDSYPYMLSNNKIEAILTKIRTAAKPTKFTHEFLKNLGFSSSNDRAIIPLFKRLGFITEEGTPTEYYDRLKDETDWQFVLGERMNELYRDLFNINTEIQKASDSEIKGAISRTTGKDEASVGRYLATFKTLAALAKFGVSPRVKEKPVDEKKDKDIMLPLKLPIENGKQIEFCQNIQIHLPATTDISVYNAIFKSIRDNLLGE